MKGLMFSTHNYCLKREFCEVRGHQLSNIHNCYLANNNDNNNLANVILYIHSQMISCHVHIKQMQQTHTIYSLASYILSTAYLTFVHKVLYK